MKTKRLTLIITILCLLSCLVYAGELPVASPQDVGMSPEKLAGVKPAVQALVDGQKIAGASVVVARKGFIVFSETFGMVDMEQQYFEGRYSYLQIRLRPSIVNSFRRLTTFSAKGNWSAS